MNKLLGRQNRNCRPFEVSRVARHYTTTPRIAFLRNTIIQRKFTSATTPHKIENSRKISKVFPLRFPIISSKIKLKIYGALRLVSAVFA